MRACVVCVLRRLAAEDQRRLKQVAVVFLSVLRGKGDVNEGGDCGMCVVLSQQKEHKLKGGVASPNDEQ